MTDLELQIWALELLITELRRKKNKPPPLLLYLPGTNQAFFNLQ